MSEYAFLLPILVFLSLGVMSPGPSFVLVAQTALSSSKKEAISVSLGLGLGACIFALIAGLGLFVVLQKVPLFYLVLKILGGLYLCFIAYKMWQGSSSLLITKEKAVSKRLSKMFILGLFTQLANPKTAIVFASAFAAFLPLDPPSNTLYILCFLAWFIDSVWYIFVALVLSNEKAKDSYSKFKKLISRIFAGMLGVMGLKLIIT